MLSKNEFINRINNTIFILVGEYKNTNTKTEFKCKKCNYIQKIRPGHILNGSGCSNCSGVRKKTHGEYIEDLYKVNPNMDCLGEYKAARKKIKHRCLICNYISDYIPNNLLRGQGCAKCANNQNIGTDTYKDKLKEKKKKIEVIDDYINRATNIKHLCLICNKEFYGVPMNILKSKSDGCPSCKITSIGEDKISNYLDIRGINYIWQYKNESCKNKKVLPFDFYLPNFKICIEYDGQQHHIPNRFGSDISEFIKIKKNDEIKNKWCVKNDIRLIRISYKEINNIDLILDNNIK